MDVDSDTPVVAAANSRAHVRGIPADTDQRVRVRPHLRDEDEVALGVSRHRVRVLRLRYFLDQDAVRTDHAERGPTGITSPRWSWTAARLSARSARTQVVTVIALVEPDLIRAGDAVDGGGVLGLRVDDQRGRVARLVLRGAAQAKIRIRSDRGPVRSSIAEPHDAAVGRRIECVHYRGHEFLTQGRPSHVVRM